MQQTASHIFHGGQILTLDDARPSVERLAIGDGHIQALGSAGEVENLRGADTVEVDLAGRTLMPAFVDHHVHLLNVGLALLYAAEAPAHYVDLGQVTSLDLLARRVEERAASLPAGSWILGQGWSQSAWGSNRLPDHRTLSSAAPHHPVYLTRVDGHAGWVNRAALRLAGLDAATPDPAGGSILRLADNEPSGVLLERANEPVLRLLPPPSDEDIRHAFGLAAAALAAQGVTEVFDAGFLAPPGMVDMGLDQERYLELLRQADAEEPLPLRVHLMLPAPSELAARMAAAPAAERQLSPRLEITHLKLFADGALGSRGALLSHPYADDTATRGIRRMSGDELRAEIWRALEVDLDVATHAIGDRAVEEVLDAYEEVLQTRPDISPGRLRIEHFSYAGESDLQRAATLGIVLSVQPNFVLPDEQGVAMEDFRVGRNNSRRVYAWGRLAGLGARLAFGSDYFTTPLPALTTFYSAVSRRNLQGQPATGWHPQERLPRAAALRLLTRSHRAGGNAASGILAVGGQADLVILSGNPLTAGEEEIPAIAVTSTWRQGRQTATGSPGSGR